MVTREDLEILIRDTSEILDLFNCRLQIKMTPKDFRNLISKLYLRLNSINRFEFKFITIMLVSEHTTIKSLSILCALLDQHKQNA